MKTDFRLNSKELEKNKVQWILTVPEGTDSSCLVCGKKQTKMCYCLIADIFFCSKHDNFKFRPLKCKYNDEHIHYKVIIKYEKT